MPSGFFSLEDIGGNAAREMHSSATFQNYTQAFQFPLYCLFLLPLLSHLGILTASPSIYLFLFLLAFLCPHLSIGVFSSQSFISSLPRQTYQLSRWSSLHFAIKPLLWHISCLCSWQGLQEKTTGSSETMLLWKVGDLWSVRFWPREGHMTELWEHLIWALCWFCQCWENRLWLVWYQQMAGESIIS